MVTSVKEGWGLVVTEAASQGAPAVVYNVDGLRDSVRHGETGLIAKHRSPESLAIRISQLLIYKVKYRKLQKAGWEWSKKISFEQSYVDFKQYVELF